VVVSRHESPKEGGEPTHELIRRKGGAADFMRVDVLDEAAVASAMRKTIKQLGALHILLCSAGVVEPTGDTRRVTVEAFDYHFAANVRGTFVCVKHALEYLVPARYGKIITVSSNFGHVGVAGLATYCASKAAVIGLTRALAIEFGPHGINVNCLCPGATKTAINTHTRADPAVQELWKRMTPLRMENDEYIAEPTDIAHAALFLASDASRFMHGACLTVDGGWVAL
jgi:NAD(P)-dependent dehydrogenase (short-subunit alcohol dehydrogenase family)